MRHLIRTTKAPADESRLRILGALGEGELCVCQLIELLELMPSTVSKHLSILRNAHLIDSRKQGRWMYYRLADEDGPLKVHTILNWVLSELAHTSQSAEDNRRLMQIFEIESEILCRRQVGNDY